MGAQGRITTYEAAAMVRRTVADATEAEEKRLDAEENVLIELLVMSFTKPAELAAAKKLPRKWLHEASSARVVARGKYFDIVRRTPEVGETPLLPMHVLGSGRLDLDKFPELAERALKAHYDCEDLTKHRDSLEAKVKALVTSVTTVKRLAEVWPDGEPYWRKLYQEWRAGRQVPTVDVASVNAALGLPKEKKAA